MWASYCTGFHCWIGDNLGIGRFHSRLVSKLELERRVWVWLASVVCRPYLLLWRGTPSTAHALVGLVKSFLMQVEFKWRACKCADAQGYFA